MGNGGEVMLLLKESKGVVFQEIHQNKSDWLVPVIISFRTTACPSCFLSLDNGGLFMPKKYM